MDRPSRSLSVARFIIGLVGLGAIAAQLAMSINTGRNLVNFFSFFTIESNIFAVISYCVMGLAGIFGMTRSMPTVRGAVTLYMTLTGIIYILLLSGNEVALQTTIGWVNLLLHYLLPLIILLDWIVFPPKQYVPYIRIVWWLIFPALYLIYSLIRGSITHWYPYPFINPITNGWPTVIVMCIFIAAVIGVIGLALCLRTRQYRPKMSM